MGKKVDVLVLGAGLTGLTTAFYLNKYGKKVMVMDTNDKTGGVIQTCQKNGFIYETGPNTGVLGTPEMAELFEDLGALCQPEFGNEKVNKRFILYKGGWEQLPAGLKQGATTPLFTLKDKFRLLGEPFRKKGTNPDETLAELVLRRMGKSFLDYAIDPFILGVYAGDPACLVPKYALPKLYNLEQTYGSFIGGSVKKKFEKKPDRDKKATRKIFAIKGGLSNLTNALQQSIGAENFLLGMSDIKVSHREGAYQISGNHKNGETVICNAEKVVTTAPAFELKNILSFLDSAFQQDLQNLFYAPVVEVAVGFEKWQGISLDGFGGLIPHKENRNVLGFMYMSSLFEGRAPDGGALLSVFIGGARRPELTKLDDEKIKELVANEFEQLMGVKEFAPDLFEISRHTNAIPQYGAESGVRYKAIDEVQKKFPGLIIGGNLHQGIGMADRVKQAKEIANRINAS